VERARLTEEEMATAAAPYHNDNSQDVAEAQLAKALRAVVNWLTQISRDGYTFEMALGELMLDMGHHGIERPK